MLGAGDRPNGAEYNTADKCKKCGQWSLKDGDNYCGYCGVVNLPLSLSETRFRLVSGVTNVLPFTIQNDSSKDLKVLFEAQTPGCELIRIVPTSELEIPAQSKGEVRLELALDSLPQDFTRENADFRIVLADNEHMSLSIWVELLAGPKLRAEPRRVCFPRLVPGSQATRDVRLFNAGQLPLTISALRLDGGPGISIEPQGPIPGELLPGKDMQVKLIFEATAQASDNSAPALLRVFADGLPEEQTVVEAYVRRVGLEASPKEILKDPCLSHHQNSDRVTLRNIGDEDITVRSISCVEPWVDIVVRDTFFTLGADAPDRNEGIRAPSQASFNVFLRTEKLEAGRYETTISVRTNLKAVGLDIRVCVQVVTPANEPHPEYLGIDFGTTASVVSIIDTLTMTPRVIEVRDPTGGLSPLIPSVLVMTRSDTATGRDDFVIGHEARSLAGACPNETVRSIKRVLGYGNDRVILGKDFTPEVLASRIIRGLADLAEYEIYTKDVALRRHSSHYTPVTKAMVTVPANFYDLQIRGILEACRMAGLDTEEEQARAEAKTKTGTEKNTTTSGIIIDEPSAAAIHFLASLSESGDVLKVIEKKGEGIFLIYDHGGGTLDVSVVHIRKNDPDLEVRVLANKGNNRVGGDSIDLAIMREMVKRCGERYPQFDQEIISSNYNYIEQRAAHEQWDAEAKASVFRARYAWKDAAEGVKIGLSANKEAKFFIDSPSIGCIQGNTYVSGRESFEGVVKSGEMEEFIRGLLVECQDLVLGAMELAGKRVDEVDYVVHTGRTSYMPLIQESIKSLFPVLTPERFILNATELKVCVAKGAALFGAMRVALATSKIRLADAGRRLPHAYGVRTAAKYGLQHQFDEVIPIGAECPISRERHFNTGDSTYQIGFYQNAGKNKNIKNNPDIKYLGHVYVKSRKEDDTWGCDVRFVVDTNRILEVYANDCLVPLQPQRFQEVDERWIG